LPVGGIGSVDLAQALFGGLFTVPTDGVLTITASYSLLQQLNLVVPGINNFANSYVDAGLALYDFNGFDPLTQQSPLLASDIRSLSNALTVPGSFTFTDSSSTNPFGLLTLTYNLIALDPLGAPIVYDFEASVTAKSAAQTPEPMTLILLGSGLAGLAIFRKRLS
jgi:hypothetical protein